MKLSITSLSVLFAVVVCFADSAGSGQITTIELPQYGGDTDQFKILLT
jgi:hypothetical protein